MDKKLVLLFVGVFLLGIGELSAQTQSSADNSKLIAIVSSDSSEATTRSVKGINQSLSSSPLPIKVMEFNLKSESKDELIARIQQTKPDLIISVGSPSTLFAKEHFPETPLIFSTVLNPATSGILDVGKEARRTITGATLDIPVEIQFEKFKLVFPKLKKVGVIYTQQTASMIEEARSVAPNLGLELISIKLESEKDVPKALDSLCRVADGIWTTADDQIYTPQATKFMILASLRNRKPIMGFSPSFVKSGALLGLIYDYKDIGRRAGELAIRNLSGEPLDRLPLSPPGVIYLHINLKTASQLGIQIDKSLVDISKEIYK